MTERILIANRGEIALRILRACHEMGKEVVAAYSQVDKDLMHLRYADDIVCIGKQSYLSMDNIIMAAKSKGCDAIHPGYGLLSENAEFVEKVTSSGLTFIGPSASDIEILGNKEDAREKMKALGLTIVPGNKENLTTLAEAKIVARQIGFPLVLKATYGGGGRGIRLIENESALSEVFEEARAEAMSSFGRSELYMEKYLAAARHIEVQLFGDGNGRAVHLGTRDCSIQRRHQKVIEEAPAPGIDLALLDDISKQSARVLAELRYKNAATLEFLFQDGIFYFLEINTRLQVEHPISEMIAGVDIVKAQIHVADHDELPFSQSEVALNGVSMECRINAEDEFYTPCPGMIVNYHPPGGNSVRVDSHVYSGYRVPHQYDSLLAKLIVWGENRGVALKKMEVALKEFQLTGIDSNLPQLRKIISDQRFQNGVYNTRFLDESGA